jgi:hypothetical protein
LDCKWQFLAAFARVVGLFGGFLDDFRRIGIGLVAALAQKDQSSPCVFDSWVHFGARFGDF